MKIVSFKVKLMLITEMLGTVPKDKEIYKTFIASKAPEGTDVEKEVESIEQMEEKGWTGFRIDKDGIFVPDYMVRGFLKNAGDNLKDQLNLKAVKSKIDRFVFVFPRTIYFYDGKERILKPHGNIERPLRAQTMQGPRVTLARSDFIKAGCTCDFSVEIVENDREINKSMVIKLFEYGKYCGLGQFRNGSYGRFEAKVM